MSVLQQKKLHSGYDASSHNASDRNAYGIDDIKRINTLIQQIESRDLSHNQMEKLRVLFSSLKKISNHNTQVDNQKSTIPHQKNNSLTQNQELNDIKEKIEDLSKNLYNDQDNSNAIIGKKISQEPSNSDQKNLHIKNDLDVLHHNIANLSKKVSELCDIISSSEKQCSDTNLDKILSKMDTLAKEYSIRNLENNWQVAEKQFKELDLKNLHQKIKSFSSKIDDVKYDLNKKNIVFNGENPNEKVLSILDNTNSLLSLLQSLNDRISSKKVYTIDVKLSDIKAAIAKNERVIESSTNNLSSIFEERLKTIEKQVLNIQNDILSQKEPAEKSLQSIKMLDKNIQKLAEDQSIKKDSDLLTEIFNKVSSIAQIADNQGISKKLDTILQNINLFSKHNNQFDVKKSFQLLEDNFKNISLQFEKKQKNTENDTLLDNLKNQIASVKDMIKNQIDSNNLYQTDKNKIGNLEDYIVETSQKTAKSILNSLDNTQNMDNIFTNKFHEFFEKLQNTQSEQMIKNFTALYEMLAKISNKLDKSIKNNNSISVAANASTLLQNSSEIERSDFDSNLREIDSFVENKNNEYHDVLNAASDQLDDSTEKNDKSIKNIKSQETDNDIPHNIQQILNRVYSIQNGVKEDCNTIPDYISAARRAALSSVIGNNTIQKQGWKFIKNYSLKKWFKITIIIAILITSSFFIAPYVSENNFFATLEAKSGDLI
ncbi:hypothetical protein [Candidatus Liberibacter americanus]|uniref:Uncharacterized protein n=1 Tax=Candidatus Liberibacter americanus str. Sao Paulo TaxID=1261131 RepID=U6B4A9_9HYPH|nr:hypothetical protein [Candidatus Liberibacter americanus]AHA27473.1 hypothetical protein lam_092 [Candidatus Liberibacter americanus str. Sao Paulo]EMS36566.1 peptidoglycan binding protein [Candidatus Liberibacter americanus PW_SP]